MLSLSADQRGNSVGSQYGVPQQGECRLVARGRGQSDPFGCADARRPDAPRFEQIYAVYSLQPRQLLGCDFLLDRVGGKSRINDNGCVDQGRAVTRAADNLG